MDIRAFQDVASTIPSTGWVYFAKETKLLSDDHHRLAFFNPSGDAPYHNSTHAAAVACAAYEMLRYGLGSGESTVQVNIHDIAAVMLAALVHDYAHSTRSDAVADNIPLAILKGVRDLRPIIHTDPTGPDWPTVVLQIEALVWATYYGQEGYQPLSDTPPQGWSPGKYEFLAGVLRDADIYSALLPECLENVMVGLPVELFQDTPAEKRPPPVVWLAKNIQFQKSLMPQTSLGAWFFTQYAADAFAAWCRHVADIEENAIYRRDCKTLLPL
jgi:3'5'-cyclic nucleotide phosphodiesterase